MPKKKKKYCWKFTFDIFFGFFLWTFIACKKTIFLQKKKYGIIEKSSSFINVQFFGVKLVVCGGGGVYRSQGIKDYYSILLLYLTFSKLLEKYHVLCFGAIQIN